MLGLSQSAISQRIKLLEARVGQPVLVRATPPSPTEIGRRLLNHVQQVRLLERDLQSQVPALDEEGLPERLRIALNADSLATWWGEAVGRILCPPAPAAVEQDLMYGEKTHRVDDRIVSISQPHVRPIVRGKAGAEVEFGAKISVSCVEGMCFVDRLSWDAYMKARI